MRLLIFICLLICIRSFGQVADSGYVKKKLSEDQIKVLTGFYSQDGNNSAVTGGKGTEELEVKSVRLTYIHKTTNKNKWIVKAGLDNITSASTDKINFVESSASYVDHRAQLTVGYDRLDSASKSVTGVFMGSSIESDYWSRSVGVSHKRKLPKDVYLGVKFSFFWDDLRWGWVKLGQWKGETMVYPIEMRGTKWYDIHHRNSFNLSTSFSWNATAKTKMGLMLDAVYQQGVIGTPFHRVYFEDGGDGAVENLPVKRLKLPLGFEMNTFLTDWLIFKNYARIYWDSFGMKSATFKLQTPIRVRYWLWAKPFIRWYYQSGISFFNPYAEHQRWQSFYTSDFDLSEFTALNYGFGIRLKDLINWRVVKDLEWRLEFYNRSDGLNFLQTALLVDFKF